MQTLQCPRCGGEITYETGRTPRLCPFCAAAFVATDPAAPDSPLEARLKAETRPKKKYAMIQAALRENPDDFAANRALLFHGRLHEPMRGHSVDFSIVKCHLMHIFEDGVDNAAAYEELLRGDQLRRTMALAPDADAFFAAYLRRLAYEYIDLFIRGDSRNARGALGFPLRAETVAARCAEAVRKMLEGVMGSARLEAGEKLLLTEAIRDGYARAFPGEVERLG
ncbi:MAG: hypothetical protein LBN04_03220 [Oscillospiraceae bacterium]|jgi:hypothetical protein|nr:hypothetical protein [Oscillospiraceae bacterium]